MNKTILNLMLFSLLPIVCNSQGNITKDEIYSYWLKSKYYQSRTDENIYMLDSVISSRIDSLKAMGVDTIGLYNLDYVRYERFHTNAERTWTVYIQWIKKNKIFNQRITEDSISAIEKIDSSMIVSYYIENKNIIDNEQIMPVITGASINENGEWLFGIEMIANSKFHTIYCYLNGESKFSRFDQHELDNENNIFHLENKNSTIVKWLVLIQKQVDDLDTKQKLK